MKIRIKVKHLAYILGLLTVLVIAFNVGAPPSHKLAEAEQGAVQAESKEQVLNKIDTAKPDNKLKLIEEYMLKESDTVLAHAYEAYIGSSGSMFSGSMEHRTKPAFNLKEKVPYLEQYVKAGRSDPDVGKAAELLAYYYEGSEQWEKASQILTNALKKLHFTEYSYARQELLFMKAKLAADMKQYGELIQLCEELTQGNKNPNLDLNIRISNLLAQYAIAEGKVPEELKRIQAEMKKQKELNEGNQRVAQLQIDQLQMIEDRLKKMDSIGLERMTDVSGTITKSDGEPVAYAGVFLRRQDDLYHSIRENEPYQTMTNEKGEYSFKGVVPGSYKLSLGLDLNQISGWTWPVSGDADWIDLRGQQSLVQDVVFQPLMKLKSPVNEAVVKGKKITFEWEPAAGAAYYNLNLGLKLQSGSSSRPIMQGIHSSRIEIDAEELYYEISGVSSSSNGSDEEKLDPLSLLGYANTDNQYMWSVEAYNANGELLTRSDGYRLGNDLTGQLPFFYLKERTMTDADRALLAGHLEDADARYKALFRSNPEDAHSLKMMFTLLEGKLMLLHGEDANTEMKKAIQEEQTGLLKQLVKLHPTADYYARLADYYLKKESWNEYNRYYALAGSLSKNTDTSYTDATHAIALMKQGKWDEAENYFKQSIENDKSHRFVGVYIALGLYRGGSLDQAIQLAAMYPDRMMYNNPLRWEDLLLEMKRESKGVTDYTGILQEKIGLYIKGKDQELKQWQPSAGAYDTAMKKFIDGLLNVG
ncbi:hypothetical protein J23TS9_25850 [Paenibacillus sp. J23TS9]|uniref:carboxypeptidase regulatory-like domain-containing protein n=1 Tax=Paenibacillus sp. J23TS9 TaxID=2807193 RepID=UPI001B160002|nr:carboxypeptidase regulatory-like domain-containing protein [Paenibacillus sp. J23TS9]GIP27455.1 hypothetical protein J23TS9_25850 [Paenibacillus sp. J23TS9]